MAQFGASIQTAQVTTGNFQTTVDPYTQTPAIGSIYAGYPQYAGNRSIPGAAYYDSTGSNSNPWGAPGKYRYVRYLDTANSGAGTSLSTMYGPAVCYWTDNTFTTVTPISSQSTTAGVNSVAGLIMPNPAAMPNLVVSGATTGQTNLNGNWIWICVAGYVANVQGVVSLAAGGLVWGSGTAFVPAFLASGSAPTQRVLGVALSSVGASPGYLFNILVTLES